MTTFKRYKFRLGILAVATMMGVTLAGCGAMRGAATRDSVLRAEMTKFIYTAPIEKVWPEAKGMFAQKGLDVTEDKEDKGAGAFLFTTQWKVVSRSGSMITSRNRYTVRGTKLDSGSKIEITHITEQTTNRSDDSWGNPSSRRDIYTELELVKRLEPGRAQEISAKAAAAGQGAREAE
jgi:hypothetical protein